MKLKNEGKEFKVMFAGSLLDIPEGEFETSDVCARHILKKVKGKTHKVTIVKIEEKIESIAANKIITKKDKKEEVDLEEANAKIKAEVKAANAKAKKEIKK